MNTYAFPSGHDPKTGTAQFGMNLRDYFAAKAMVHFLADKYVFQECQDENKNMFPLVCSLSYEVADAMMKARDE
jgi:hypothetical protein